MKNRIAMVGLLTATATVVGAAPASAATEHCPEHSSSSYTKVELGGEVTSLALPVGTIVCIKAGTEARTVVVTEPTGVVNPIVNQHGAPRGISYYVVYGYEDPGGYDDDYSDQNG